MIDPSTKKPPFITSKLNSKSIIIDAVNPIADSNGNLPIFNGTKKGLFADGFLNLYNIRHRLTDT